MLEGLYGFGTWRNHLGYLPPQGDTAVAANAYEK